MVDRVDELCHIIQAKKKKKGLGCKIMEYRLVLDTLCSKSPCNFLIFGLGYDSPVWIEANKGGRTSFIENIRYWIRVNKKLRNELVKMFFVKYSTKLEQWKNIIDNTKKLQMSLPQEIIETKWDIIFIDGPQGFKKGTPGRMQSIYASSLLAKKHFGSTDIFVHDINRPVESEYTAKYLKNENIIRTCNLMRHFRIINDKI